MPKHVESDRRHDGGACAGISHGTQLLGALPAPRVVAAQQAVVRRAACDQALDELRCLVGQGNVTHVPAFALADGERPDIVIVVGGLEPIEFAVKRATLSMLSEALPPRRR